MTIMKEVIMNRRELLGKSTVALGAIAAATASTVGGVALASNKKAASLIDAANDCIAVSEECLTHCFIELGKGDKSMAECAVAVRETLAACRGLVTLAASESKHLKEFAAVCSKICRDCEAACKKHEKHHAICKRCMEACAACASACEAV